MAENTQSAKCSQAEYEAARRAGLLVVTTADERAIHAFADAIRAQLLEHLAAIASYADAPHVEPEKALAYIQQTARTAIAGATA